MGTRSDPTILVNDIPYAVVPESVKHKFGKGEQKVDAASVGGGSVEMNVTEDATTKVSMMKFKLFTTTENEAAFILWKQTPGANTVVYSEVGQKPLTGTFMTCISDPEWEDSSSGQVEIEFAGSPLT